MNETLTTVRGTVITDPTTRRVGDDQVFTFRVASNTRYQDRTTGEWKTGGTLYFSANCWGRLAQRAPGSVCKGDGIIIHGRLLTNEYERDGRINRDLEMRVSALGPDLSRMDVSVRRASQEEPAFATGGGDPEGSGAPVDPAEVMAIGSVDTDPDDEDADEAPGLVGVAGV
jgi:single-strand DNA-binding protein